MAVSLLLCPLLALTPSAPIVLGPVAVASPSSALPTLFSPLAASPVPQAAPAAAAPSEEPLKAGGPRWTNLLQQARLTTAAATRRIMAMRGAVRMRAALATSDTKTITEYTGAPGRVEVLNAPGRVYRHWVLKKEDLASILEQGALRAGPVSYVDFTGSSRAFIKDIYVDIHGSFFTTPEHAAAEPRVMNQAAAYYVDFRLPEGVSALRLDGDDVLVIPAEPGTYLPIEVVGSSR